MGGLDCFECDTIGIIMILYILILGTVCLIISTSPHTANGFRYIGSDRGASYIIEHSGDDGSTRYYLIPKRAAPDIHVPGMDGMTYMFYAFEVQKRKTDTKQVVDAFKPENAERSLVNNMRYRQHKTDPRLRLLAERKIALSDPLPDNQGFDNKIHTTLYGINQNDFEYILNNVDAKIRSGH